MRHPRVVITGLGVIAPNGHGLEAYERSLRHGISGLRRIERLVELNFACQVAGVPEGLDALREQSFTPEELVAINANMAFSNIAAIDAWRDAGLPPPGEERDRDTGAIIGTGMGGPDTFGERLAPAVLSGKVRRLGSTIAEQVMSSSVSAKTAGLLGLGNQVTTNSSACTTGAEAVVMAADRIRLGLARRMLAGASEAASEFVFGAFDAMRVLDKNHNHEPERASRPMSQSAAGFVPGLGRGRAHAREPRERRGPRRAHLRRDPRVGGELRRPSRRAAA